MININRLEKTLYFARKQVEHCSPYVWGGQGEKLAKLPALKLAQMESSAENAARVEKYIYEHLKLFDKHTKIFDCSGLVCCALIYSGVLRAGEDYTAAGLYDKFNKIMFAARRAGDLIYKADGSGKISHVGICISETEVIEMKGRDYGCIISTITDSWNRANRPEY